jgi:hypothetical protein
VTIAIIVISVVIGLGATVFGIWMGSGWSPSRKEREQHAGETPAVAAIQQRQRGWIRGTGQWIGGRGGTAAASGTVGAGAPIAGAPLTGRAMVGDTAVEGSGPDGSLRYRLALDVDVGGKPSYRVEVHENVPSGRSARVYRGASLPVIVDSADPQRVTLDWSRS